MYNLKDDLGEMTDLKETESSTFDALKLKMTDYDNLMMEPLWTEGQMWDTITWLIHEDLYNNREVRVKNPGQLTKYMKTLGLK